MCAIIPRLLRSCAPLLCVVVFAGLSASAQGLTSEAPDLGLKIAALTHSIEQMQSELQQSRLEIQQLRNMLDMLKQSRDAIKRASETTAIVHSANMSLGVNVLFGLLDAAARALGDAYDVEIVELHHRLKKDAPSGTAKKLTEILMETRKIDKVRHGRDGNMGERLDTEIGIHAVRGGDVVGDHTVIFAGPSERLELTHRASNRETFARGALCAASWIIGKPPGLYSMQDVLGL